MGTVAPAANGTGSTMSLSGTATASTTVDAAGNYSFNSLGNGTYTVTPSRAGYAFTPPSQSITINGATAPSVNFTAAKQTAQTFSISGMISPTTGGSGATVTLSGAASVTTTADGSGNFSFSGLANGGYTVTPSKTGFTFNPVSQSAAVNGANITGIAFTATAQSFGISGTITGGSGATVTLSGAGSATTTANTSGNYTFSGLGNGSYTVTPSEAGFTMSPSTQSVTVNGASVTAVNFTAAAQTFSISGTITGGSGATVTLSGAASATTTANASGNYTFSGLANGSYTVTPSEAGFTMSPSSRSVTVNGANVTAINFIATAPTFSVSGTLTPTAGGSGASVTLSGLSTATTTANSSGNYSFTGLVNGGYAVTPGNAGYSFSPTSQAVTINGANVTGVNFTATAVAPTYTLSGNISPASSGAGSTVTLSGAASFSTTADSSGNYSFTALANGAYTVTPSSSTATFSPTSQPVTISNGNVSGVNFTATATANVVFFDDFLGTTLSNQWVALNRHGDYSNSELQCYLPANVTVSNSYLNILSQVQSQSCGDSDHAASTWNYTSGMVQWSTFNYTYGTLEFRAEMAGGQGTWPAIWLLGSNCQATNVSSADNSGACNWPQPGSDEIDVTEILNGNHTSVNQEIHTVSSNAGCTATTTDVSQNFHVYQLVWEAGSLIWKIDGTTTCTLTQNIPTTPMFLIINTAMGGAGGSVNNSTLPQTLQVDYVKVTQP
jgi:Glycosyl hydrolases family 16/Carboxypeptidase regulatory-like domain